ncbi:MAG: DUF541 domain-containing protein [Crocinitomix sp.]|nr:DUF541 domain-containing protein [Crocinitomix sp.]
MKNFKNILLFALVITTGIVLSQASGNQVYGNNNNGYNNNYYAQPQTIQKRGILTTDSTLNINVNILLNKEADGYLITVGTNQEAKTVLECNKKINARINKLVGQLAVFGVEEDDIYVDFISQTKVFDYEVGDDRAEQFQSGYEIKKNINIKLQNIDYIDQLIELASEQEIYDIIKIEYIDEDIEETYSKMYKEAVSLVKSRLKLYDEMNDFELSGTSRILGDNFYAVSPKTQYRKYQAFESSQLDVYRNHDYSKTYIQKEARKNNTFYYEGVATGGFDKIINANQPKIGLQYVFSLSMLYEIE